MRTASAVLLFIQGTLTLLMSGFLLFISIFGPAMQAAEGNFGDDDLFAGIFYGVLSLVGLTLAVVQLAGGLATATRKSWLVGMAGGVASILSGLMCCNILGLALGVAATVLLSLPETRVEFEEA